MPNSFAQLGSGNGLQPFKTVKDYDDFLKRLDGFVEWTDQAIVNMREGASKGYTLPRVLAERVLPQLEAHIVAKPEDSLYWGPIRNMPASFPAEDRERLTAAYRAAIDDEGRAVVPQAARLHARRVPAEVPRTSVGLDALPDGKAWYEYRVRDITTTNLTPAQIHEIGLSEVERIRGEMQGVMAQVGFKGNLDEFFRFLNTDPQFVLLRPRGAHRRLRCHPQARESRSCRSCSRSCRRRTTRCARSSRSARRARRAASTRRRARTARGPASSTPTPTT